MKLEDQVVSLELAKELKELGVPKNSLLIWIDEEGDVGLYRDDGYRPANPIINYFEYPAFTVAELGEMLPRVSGYNWRGNKTARGNAYEVKYRRRKNGVTEVLRIERAFTEADARAKMLVYLIQNNLITL